MHICSQHKVELAEQNKTNSSIHTNKVDAGIPPLGHCILIVGLSTVRTLISSCSLWMRTTFNRGGSSNGALLSGDWSKLDWSLLIWTHFDQRMASFRHSYLRSCSRFACTWLDNENLQSFTTFKKLWRKWVQLYLYCIVHSLFVFSKFTPYCAFVAVSEV